MVSARAGAPRAGIAVPAERLQKILAAAGFGSRRGVEQVIVAGRVTVDGRVATLGERADAETQRVELDGRPVTRPAETITWMLNKPTGYVVSAADEQHRQTVYDLLRRAPRGLKYVGRLDIDSEGLLLLTTDGELAHRLTHPRYAVWKTYEADVIGEPNPQALDLLRDGIELEDGVTAPARAELLSGGDRSCVRIALREGKKREVRRMLAAVGHPVTRLIRVEFGSIRLGMLSTGEARPLTGSEARDLGVLVGLVDASA